MYVPVPLFQTQGIEILTTGKQIVHVAAPLLDNPANTDYDRDFLKPSVDGYASLHCRVSPTQLT